MNSPSTPIDIPLGKSVAYPASYDASLLAPIARSTARHDLGLPSEDPLPFIGWDLWNAYELSWLNAKGLPKVALLKIRVPCSSPNIVESKSFKLYLNSFNQTRFDSMHEVFDCLRNDLQNALGDQIEIEIIGPDQFNNQTIEEFDGINLDKFDIDIDCYEPNVRLLKLDTNVNKQVEQEKVFSRLLKSNCPVTDQPDWACIEIEYSGQAIEHASLLKYIVSYRTHNGFHEHCVEKIFVDIMKQCHPTSLSVFARYTRRGGLDINPWRGTKDSLPPQIARSARQ